MTKPTATALAFAALSLAACSTEEPTRDISSANTSSDATSTEQDGGNTTTAAAPCPANEPTGPKKAPSAAERCDGAYDCYVQYAGNPGAAGHHTRWLAFDGHQCLYDGYEVLGLDGAVLGKAPDAEVRGHWEGDYTKFSIDYAEGSRWDACTRKPD